MIVWILQCAVFCWHIDVNFSSAASERPERWLGGWPLGTCWSSERYTYLVVFVASWWLAGGTRRFCELFCCSCGETRKKEIVKLLGGVRGTGLSCHLSMLTLMPSLQSPAGVLRRMLLWILGPVVPAPSTNTRFVLICCRELKPQVCPEHWGHCDHPKHHGMKSLPFPVSPFSCRESLVLFTLICVVPAFLYLQAETRKCVGLRHGTKAWRSWGSLNIALAALASLRLILLRGSFVFFCPVLFFP